ncbi:bifunctional 23S rRNA (guanine(2069)-N(7))-methyltransferase RlmK/23S rRNA (guanine(2445)-N(2))-methyltransferase RlmL [Glaciecola sp. MH2013]|uniref:bifunctional 23S rRNA (guanine(2069)-N(7))-methyltransferase RlmK/23S rRNA (guanine(2445)-N(2))-methyltransferase RlmL n=1 Tax=Glaciecola sp. MH2013 TaxID=2785524 RepID=UPI00189FDCFE|nr:bifunctional 23S rRNA (guanine(2069)-N(7))-methyltransferase RlmK/23S rRNA (guanine(2445)-N(2))-methyltransferase RlmL [Glaciecola sp. MH2013]MBF7072798.1 bifunctional 23S rRNA (guanine(2069)-N(7))-methyltransferase RlmK/23S rRNA (guanine(2445)-N(2))-methyltransferase RlmL [Glaciecola sp. MH2013]
MPEIIVTTSKGLDEILKQEVSDILRTSCKDKTVDFPTLQLKPGQVSFEGSLEQAYQLCLYSRLANRVLWVVGHGKVNSADELYDVVKGVDWPSQFESYVPFMIQFNGTNNAINNSQFGALKAKDAIVDQFQEQGHERPSIDKLNPGIVIQARLRRDNLHLCIDLSGGSLHKRGYRSDTGEAPLKEHVAAGIIMRSGWLSSGRKPLLDPMCGSGTIAIEAAMMAANIAPNLHKEEWGFQHWLGHDGSIFRKVHDAAVLNQREPAVSIFAYDLSTKLIDLARENAKNAGVEQYIIFKQCDVLDATVEAKELEVLNASNNGDETLGYIISNPPYGERLSEYTALLPLFDKLGARVKEHFPNWQLSLLSSNQDLLKALKLRYSKSYKIMNGKLECVFVNYQLSGQNLAVFAAQETDNHEFANRLKKNIKRMKSWINKANTNAYRIYDADLPHYNVAIDIYNDWVIVQEYAAPKDVPEEKARQRLQEVLIHVPKVLGISPNNMAVKTRRQNKGKEQYQRVATKGKRLVVHEHGAQFYINPTDYLDVGLFLDHRDTRLRFKQACQGKDVLNLFAYTGSVSVHAAQAQAKSVTTVDMSNTYLGWAKENFELNRLQGSFQFIQADCTKWLADHNAKYDLIFIDPPSFSNSKRMEDTWDVQRDHIKLLGDAKKCLNVGGTIFFSNNLRGFKLDLSSIEKMGFKVCDISKDSIPEDFKRNQRIHQLWLLTL